jgi:hypothetical protein
MTLIEGVGLAASIIAIFEAGYVIGKWRARKERKVAEDEIVAKRLKQVLGLVRIAGLDCDSPATSPGQTITLNFAIISELTSPFEVWLGASIVDKSWREHFDVTEDKLVVLEPGKNRYSRYLTIPKDVPIGEGSLVGAVWLGQRGKPENSIRMARSENVPFKIQNKKGAAG